MVDIDKKITNRIQSIVGTLLYYARSVDPTMFPAINEISRFQSKPTRDTKEKAAMLLYFAATDPNEVICYKASDMVIHVDSDTSYISMPEARSWYARNFYLSNWTSPRPIKPTPKINGPIHTECKTIRNVVSSAAEAEKCGTYNNVK